MNDLLDFLAPSLLNSRADAIVVADRHGIIRFWNPGAERIFGHPRSDALGQSLDLIIPEPLRARHWAEYKRVMDGGESRYGEGDLLAVPGLRKDGTRISLEFTIVPMVNASGSLVGIAAVMRDVTARFEEMRALRRRLREASITINSPA
jgi:PAS domain S-box-containing protein